LPRGFQGELELIGWPKGTRDADDRVRIGGSEVGEEFRGGEAGAGIDGIGGDFHKGDEDEGALCETGMRDFEVEFREDEVAVEEEIEVEGARAVGRGGGVVAAEVALDGQERVEDDARSEIGIEGNDGVEEAGLIGEIGWGADGRSGVERGAGGDAAVSGEEREDGGERGVGRTSGAGEVGAEGEEGEGHGIRLAELAGLAG